MENLECKDIHAYISARLGTTKQYSFHELNRTIKNRMHFHEITEVSQYVRLLKQSEEELDLCISASTIKETYFFREPAYLTLLTKQLLVHMLQTQQTITIVSIGCSIGAEPYSIAIAIEEAMGSNILSRCKIIGYDVDKEALRKARAGIFSSFALRNLSEARKNSYFRPLGGTLFELKASIRRSVDFSFLSLLDSPKVAQIPLCDVMLYRNVSIYFDMDTRIQVFTALSQRIAPNGILITGATETLSHDLGIMELVNDQGFFYYRPHTVGVLQKPIENVHNKLDIPHVKQQLQKTSSLDDVKKLALQGEYEEALLQLRTIDTNHALDILCLKAGINYCLNRFDDALDNAQQILNQDSLRMEGFLINAMVLRLQNQPEKALHEFKKVLYLHAECWVASYYCAELYRNLGELPFARTYLNRTIDALQIGVRNDQLLVFPINRIDTQQLIRLCRLALGRL